MSVAPLPLTLEELESEFQTWRSQKKYPREKVPEDLWQKAISLLPRYNQGTIIKRLHINREGFKKRLAPQALGQQISSQASTLVGKDQKTAFVEMEIPFPPVSQSPVCDRVEFERADGSRMSLYASPAQPFDINSLMTTFLGENHASSHSPQ